jgi:hypothetical protein
MHWKEIKKCYVGWRSVFVRTALFWVITQRVVVISYGHFGTTYQSHPRGSRILLESGRNYHYLLCNNPDECSCQVLQGGSLQSCKCVFVELTEHNRMDTIKRATSAWAQHFEVEVAIEKLKIHKTPHTDWIIAELINAGGRKIHSEIYKLNDSLWNKEELPQQWKKSVIVPVFKKDDKTDCSIYWGMSLMSTTYKSLSIILLPKLTPYVEEITGNHQFRFQCNRSMTDRIFCICQILEKKWEYNEAVHQLFIDLRKAYDSVRREVLHNILIEFGIPMLLVGLIETCLEETCSIIQVSETFVWYISCWIWS